jgi:hypothetical protein
MHRKYNAIQAILACALLGASYGALVGAGYGGILLVLLTLGSPGPPFPALIVGGMYGLFFGACYGFSAGFIAGCVGGPVGWGIGGVLGGLIPGFLLIPNFLHFPGWEDGFNLITMAIFPGLIGGSVGVTIGRAIAAGSPVRLGVPWLVGIVNDSPLIDWLGWRGDERGNASSPARLLRTPRSPEDNLTDFLQIELPGADAFEEEESVSRNAELLNGLRVASPCDASWEEMEGDDLVRFCQHCQKNVYNLSGMSRREAAEFVRETEGKLCVRFYRRRDGTLLTDNCPVGFRGARRLLLKCVGSVAATALGLFGVLSPVLGPPITGEIAFHRRKDCEMGGIPLSPSVPPAAVTGRSREIAGTVDVTPRRQHQHRRWRDGRRR